MSESFRDESRKAWSRDSGVTMDDVKLGCLQRIADATEAMAKEHNRLLRDNECLRTSRREAMDCSARLARSNASLRGQITKLKRRSQA